jgi:hypothetical protein
MADGNATIISAILALVGAIAGAVITAFGPEFLRMFRSKDARFTGKWQGEAQDVDVPGYISFDHSLKFNLDMELTKRGNSVRGQLHIRGTGARQFSGLCNIESIAISGDFVALKYALTKEDAGHFGVVVLELREADRELHGFFLSKKIFEKRLGFGAAILKRQ